MSIFYAPHVERSRVCIKRLHLTLLLALLPMISLHTACCASSSADMPSERWSAHVYMTETVGGVSRAIRLGTVTPDSVPNIPSDAHWFLVPDTSISPAALGEALSAVEPHSLHLRSVTEDHLHVIADSESIRELVLWRASLSDDDFKVLRTISQLKALDLSYVDSVDSNTVKHISSMGELVELRLNGTAVSDSDIASHVADMDHLSRLDLSYTRISDDSLHSLSRMQNLNSIVLTRTNITDDGVAHLRDMRQLKELKLAGTKISDEGLQEVSHLSLVTLDVSHTNAGPEIGRSLRTMRKLETLSLAGLDLDATDGFAWLSDLTKLQHLDLEATRIGANILDKVATLENLRSLKLGNTPISNNEIKRLKAIESLEYLDLSFTSVGSEGVMHLAKHPNLRWIQLWGTPVDDEAIPAFMSMPRLERLAVPGTEISQRGWEKMYERGLVPFR